MSNGKSEEILKELKIHAVLAKNSYDPSSCTILGIPYDVVHTSVSIYTGFSACLYRKRGSSEYVIGYAGTDELIDMKANVGNYNEFLSNQRLDAILFMISCLTTIIPENLGENTRATCSVTGHSLGGCLAEAIVWYLDNSTQDIEYRCSVTINKCLTFNAAGGGRPIRGYRLELYNNRSLIEKNIMHLVNTVLTTNYNRSGVIGYITGLVVDSNRRRLETKQRKDSNSFINTNDRRSELRFRSEMSIIMHLVNTDSSSRKHYDFVSDDIVFGGKTFIDSIEDKFDINIKIGTMDSVKHHSVYDNSGSRVSTAELSDKIVTNKIPVYMSDEDIDVITQLYQLYRGYTHVYDDIVSEVTNLKPTTERVNEDDPYYLRKLDDESFINIHYILNKDFVGCISKHYVLPTSTPCNAILTNKFSGVLYNSPGNPTNRTLFSHAIDKVISSLDDLEAEDILSKLV